MSLVETLLRTSYEDTDLLKKNDAHGDDFSKPRTVDFALYAVDETKALLVRDFVNDNQYGDASVASVDGKFRILIRIFMPTTQQLICSVSGFMACIAKIYTLEYDGWGCELKLKSTEPRS